MNYGQALRHPFNRPGWFVNALLLAVCLIIPVVGPLVLIGYGTIVMKVAVRDPNAQLVKFDFGLFMKYLERGVAPFVVSIVASLVLVPVIFLCWVPFFITMIMGAQHGREWIVMIGMGVSVLLEILGIFLFTVLALPMQIRAELEGNIGSAFNVKYALGFTKKMWGTVFVMMLVMAGVGILGTIVGILACGVGIYVVMGMLMVVQWHMRAQLYLMSLERGVPAIVVKADELVGDGTGGFVPVMNS